MTRTLKVVPTGDFYRRKVVPQIRIQGKWVQKAGIEPGSRIEIENPSPGVLIIRQIPLGGMSCASPT